MKGSKGYLLQFLLSGLVGFGSWELGVRASLSFLDLRQSVLNVCRSALGWSVFLLSECHNSKLISFEKEKSCP